MSCPESVPADKQSTPGGLLLAYSAEILGCENGRKTQIKSQWSGLPI
jgi:hypothetical protein